MKMRNNIISNSNSSNFIVDEETNTRYVLMHGFPIIDGVPIKCNNMKCMFYHGESDSYYAIGYDNDEEYVRCIYDDMLSLNPKFIEWC